MAEKKLLATIAAEITICTKCPLSRTRNKAVPGEGNSKNRIMLIGEAPGRSEDVQGRPFVGAAGKFLDSLLFEIGFPREDVFIGNVLKCRPPRNRGPLPDEIQTCTPYLDRQIKAIRPRLIVTLGNYSTAYVFSKAKLSFNGITQVRGKPHKASILGVKVKIFPTFHPAAALYSAKYKEQITSDFSLLKHEHPKKEKASRQSARSPVKNSASLPETSTSTF